MKSYNHLWEKLIDDENIKLAIKNASKGKMKREKLIEIKNNLDLYVSFIKKQIYNYTPAKHYPKIINDGITAKQRIIIVPSVYEHIIQHAIMNILKPIIKKGMYLHSYASVPKRGAHAGMQTIKKWFKKDRINTQYCLKIDIKKYFESISQKILINKLKEKIHDEKFINLLIKVIKTVNTGLPLGFYTSQWFANFYLQEFDHYIKENIKGKYYIRYMDDIVIFDKSKKKLHQIKQDIADFFAKINLQIKKNWQVFQIHNLKENKRFLDFMGFRFYMDKITLRRKILRRIKRKVLRIFKKGNETIFDIRQIFAYFGWLKYTNTYHWYLKNVKKYIDINKLRLKMSIFDKSLN